MPTEGISESSIPPTKTIFKAIRQGDKAKAKSLQKLVLSSHAARMLAIRQVTQLILEENGWNRWSRVSNVQGTIPIREKTLKQNTKTWQHQGLREIPIPKKDGTKRILKVPTIADRVWQCLVKYALEPAHEAEFHARSYGFRPGRSTHDAQRILYNNLRSYCKGINKRIL